MSDRSLVAKRTKNRANWQRKIKWHQKRSLLTREAYFSIRRDTDELARLLVMLSAELPNRRSPNTSSELAI
jgi:hypothetical protein